MSACKPWNASSHFIAAFRHQDGLGKPGTRRRYLEVLSNEGHIFEDYESFLDENMLKLSIT